MKKNISVGLKNKLFFPFITFITIILCILFLTPKLRGDNEESKSELEYGKIWKDQPQKLKINDDLSVIYQQNTSSKITVIHILIRGGKRAVEAKKRGLAFLTTRLAVELPVWNSLKQLMQLGSSIYYNIDGDFASITIRSLSKHIDQTLEILLKSIKKPLFSGIRIEKVKDYMEHRRRGEGDAPEQLMELTLISALSPIYGGSIFGNHDTLERIKKKDITDFYKRYFNFANFIISVCSDMEKPELTAILAKHFESFPTGSFNELTQVSASVPEKKQISLDKKKQQVLISFGALLPEMSRKNYVLIYMLENLLGKGIGSKLWPLRSQKKLAYSLKTRFVQLQGAGLLTIFLKTDIEKKQKAHRELKNLLIDIYSNGLTPEDLKEAKVLSRVEFLKDNETKERRAQSLSYFEFMGAGYRFFEDFFSEVEGVTLDELNTYLKKILNPDQLLELTIGPEDSEEPAENEESVDSIAPGNKT